MSKRTRKKQTQTANYLTLSAQEQSPKVGSILEYKNTIIVKKITGGGVEIFYTDQNGKVMQENKPERLESEDLPIMEELPAPAPIPKPIMPEDRGIENQFPRPNH